MPSVVRSILAVLAGCIVAFVLIAGIQFLNTSFYPFPAGLDPSNREAMSSFMATLPLGAFLMVLLSYAVGALAGGFVAARLAPRAPKGHALAVAALLVGASIMNLTALPHPTWFMVANLIVVVAMPLAGARLAGGKEPIPAG
jgi:hypothetical protein